MIRKTGFDAMDVAMELIAAVGRLTGLIGRRDPDLARQLRRAVASVALNLAEGNRRIGADRRHLWRIAAGSADETRTALLAAEAFGYVRAVETAAAHELCDRELAMLWRLTHPLR